MIHIFKKKKEFKDSEHMLPEASHSPSWYWPVSTWTSLTVAFVFVDVTWLENLQNWVTSASAFSLPWDVGSCSHACPSFTVFLAFSAQTPSSPLCLWLCLLSLRCGFLSLCVWSLLGDYGFAPAVLAPLAWPESQGHSLPHPGTPLCFSASSSSLVYLLTNLFPFYLLFDEVQKLGLLHICAVVSWDHFCIIQVQKDSLPCFCVFFYRFFSLGIYIAYVHFE